MNKIWNDLIYPHGRANYPSLNLWNTWGGNVETKIGGLTAGFRSDFYLHGYRMLEELTGQVTFIQTFVLALTGNLPNKSEDRLLNAIFSANAIVDPRFWLFRTARLGATVKSSPSAAIATGIMTNEGEFLASGAAYQSAVFLQNSLKKIKNKETSINEIINEKLKKKEIISGYGRVLARGSDERNFPLLKVAAECGLDKGEYLKLALEIEFILQNNKNPALHMNNAGLVCALLSDMNFTPPQIMIFYSLVFLTGICSNVLEAYENPPGQFLPMGPDDINYTGYKLRKMPLPENQQLVFRSNNTRVVVMDSISFIGNMNKGDFIVCGSHGGMSAGYYCLKFMPKGVIFNDAGRGKDSSGITGLRVLDKSSIPAATVSFESARIGDGMDCYTNGRISFFNELASKCGVQLGDSVKKAAQKILASTT